MENWLRKNPFIRSLRETLQHFRIESMNVKMGAEMREVDHSATPTRLEDFKYTGREVITITIYGWRRPRKDYPGIIETLTPPAPEAEEEEHADT